MAKNKVRRIEIRFNGNGIDEIKIARFGARSYTSPSWRNLVRFNNAMAGKALKFVSFGTGGIVLDVMNDEAERPAVDKPQPAGWIINDPALVGKRVGDPIGCDCRKEKNERCDYCTEVSFQSEET